MQAKEVDVVFLERIQVQVLELYFDAGRQYVRIRRTLLQSMQN